MKEPIKQMIEQYEIHPHTMLILPISYGSRIYSKIYEMEDEYLSPFKPLDIIKKSCHYFGASYNGRKDGTRELIGITHKPPIAISPSHHIYFFPTTSPSSPECLWISPEHVLSHKPNNGNQTLVTFKNKKTFTLPLSNSSFLNQLLRTALLKSKLMQRMDEWDRNLLYSKSYIDLRNASEHKRKYNF